MEIVLLAGIFGLAILDSINPSALLATGYLLKRAPEQTKKVSVLAYVAGIFVFYFAMGLLLLLGVSFLANGLGSVFESRAAYGIQAAVGVALFIWSWIPPKSPKQKRWQSRTFTPGALFALGVSVTLVEFVTALPYVGAITLLQEMKMDFALKLGVLLLYNIIFILPPLGMLVFYLKNRQRFTEWQARRAAKSSGKPDNTLQWIAGAAGVLLFLNALSGLGMSEITISL